MYQIEIRVQVFHRLAIKMNPADYQVHFIEKLNQNFQKINCLQFSLSLTKVANA